MLNPLLQAARKLQPATCPPHIGDHLVSPMLWLMLNHNDVGGVRHPASLSQNATAVVPDSLTCTVQGKAAYNVHLKSVLAACWRPALLRPQGIGVGGHPNHPLHYLLVIP
jgi:hypothetical protein